MTLDGYIQNLEIAFRYFSFRDAIDIVLVALVVYWLLKVTSHTRAMQVLRGLGIILIIYLVCYLANFETIGWLLNYIIGAGAIAIVILFQPELRAALERLGRGKIFEASNPMLEDTQVSIEHLHHALLDLSKSRTGAIVVIEQRTGLKDVMESGTLIGALITNQLLESIFFPNSPMHDGAVIIRGLRVAAAGCFLPLSTNTTIDRELGTRHRAALGISEVSDSVTFVVSEETGIISMARNGQLTRYLNSKQLSEILSDLYADKANTRIFGHARKSREAAK